MVLRPKESTMPKMKSRHSILRRFRVSGRGKILRRSSFNRHLKRKKSKARVRRLSVEKVVSGRIKKKLARLLKV